MVGAGKAEAKAELFPISVHVLFGFSSLRVRPTFHSHLDPTDVNFMSIPSHIFACEIACPV